VRKIFLFILVLVVLIGVIAAEKQTDLQMEKLFGKVKSVTRTCYDAKEWFGEWIQGDVRRIDIDVYNTEGYKTESKSKEYIQESDIWPRVVLEVPIETESGSIVYIPESDIWNHILYIYITKDNITEITSYNADGTFNYKSQYTYDENDNLIEESTYLTEETLFSKSIYVYDEMGNRTENNYYSGDGSIASKYFYFYDNKGNKVEELIYHSEGILKYRMLYTYDDEGNLTETVTYNGKLPDSKAVYFYDDKGNLTEENGFSVYLLDDWLHEEPKYFNVYEYDIYDNWVVKTRSKEVTKFGKTYPEPYEIIIREITYYPEISSYSDRSDINKLTIKPEFHLPLPIIFHR